MGHRMNRLRIGLLGEFRLLDSSGCDMALASHKAQGLLAYLAYAPGQARTRESLATLLWGDSGEQRARASLRQCLSSLRQALGPSRDIVVCSGDQVAVDPARLQVDAAAWQQKLDDESPAALEEALALYRGPFLAGLSIGASAFDEWVAAERERIRAQVVRRLGLMLAHQEAGDRPDEAIATALRLLALDAAHEEAHRALMRLYDRQGRRSDALRQYRTCAAALRDELAVEPTIETRRLHQSLAAAEADGSAHSHRWTAVSSAVSQWSSAHVTGPCIGRNGELAAIDRLVADARRGWGRLLVLAGESGIGKSRLAAEFAQRATLAGARVVLARCHETEHMLPFAPWIDAMRMQEQDVPTNGAARDQRWPGALETFTPDILASRCDFDLLRVFEGFLAALGGLACRRPLAIVVEDLQWADSLSLRLLSFIGLRLLPGRVAILVTVCTAAAAEASELGAALEGLARGHCLSRLDLSRLDRASSDRLVEALLPSNPEKERAEAARAVWSCCEGSPLLITEAVAAMIDGDPAMQEGSPLPMRVRHLIGGRLDRLSPAARQMAALAAVAGRGADQSLLVSAWEGGADEAVRALEELAARGILQCVGDRADFAHEAIRLTALGRLLPVRSQRLHHRLAMALEWQSRSRTCADVMAIGQHYLAAQEWMKAAAHLHRAGRDAMRQSAYREAVATFELALAASRRDGPPGHASELELDIRVDIGRALIPLGQVRKVGEHLDAAADLAASLNDDVQRARLLVSRINEAWLSARYDDAEAAAAQVARIADERGDVRLSVATGFHRGQVAHFRGQYARAAEHFRRNLELTEGLGEHDPCGLPGIAELISSAWLVWSLAELGEFEEGESMADELVCRAEERDHPFTLVDVYRAVALFHLRRGAIDRGLQLLERGMAVVQARRLDLWQPSFAAALGHACTLAGDRPRALRLCQEAVDLSESSGIVAGHSLRKAWLADALLAVGQFARAHQVADEACAGAVRNGERASEAWLLHLKSRILAVDGTGRFDASMAALGSAMSLANELCMRPLLAHCHLTLRQVLEQCDPRLTEAGEGGVRWLVQ